MKYRNDIKEELDRFAPKLSKIEKKEIFSLPDDYFEELTMKILDQTVNNPTTVLPLKTTSKKKYLVITGLAAAAIGLILLAAIKFDILKRNFKPTNNFDIYALEYIDTESIIEYLSENNLDPKPESLNQLIDEIDENLIIEEL